MRKHIPNIITCCNLICGCIAVSNALLASVYLLDNPVSFRMRMTHYALAVAFMVLGAVFDFFDGMIARALGVSSPIGKELDSLADVITFGLAPSMMIFTLFQEVECPTLHSSWPASAHCALPSSTLTHVRQPVSLDSPRQPMPFSGAV